MRRALALAFAPFAARAAQAQPYVAPKLTLPDVDGRNFIHLPSGDDRPVLLNFWHPDCPPCAAEWPLLAGLAASPGTALRVLAVSTATHDETRRWLARRAPAEAMVQAMAGVDAAGLLRRWGNAGGALPYSVLVDGRQRVLARHLGALDANRLQAWRGLAAHSQRTSAGVLSSAMVALAVAATGPAHADDVATASVAAAAAASESQQSITITAKRSGLVKPSVKLDDIVKTESFSAEELMRVGASNLNEALDKRPGIAVQVECSICNVRNVVLNNLPGRYTTLLIDGIPIYSSVSSAYGLDSVGLNGVERIDVARGAGASLIAPEALSGAVNVITRRPKASEAIAQVQAGGHGAHRAELYGAQAWQAGALSLAYSLNDHPQVDDDGDGISEYTGYKRQILGLGGFADDLGGFALRGRIDVVNEKRNGGSIGRDYDAIRGSLTGSGGYDFSRSAGGGSPDPRGWVVPDGSGPDTLADGSNGIFWDKGRGGFSEVIFTDCAQFTLVAERQQGWGTLRLAAASANHRQDSFYEGIDYQAEQEQHYAEASVRLKLGEMAALTAGANWRYEDLRNWSATNPDSGLEGYRHEVPGLFVQAWREWGSLQANLSLRWDEHNVYGRILTPRLNLQYDHDSHYSSRLALGKGYRAPTSFFEQDHGILSTLRVVRRIDRAESSKNLSYALNYTSDLTSWTLSLNHTRIDNFALLDSSACQSANGNVYAGPCNGDDASVTLFSAAPDPVTVRGADFTVTHLVTPALAATAAVEATQYSFKPGTLVFARPTRRAYLTLDYDRDGWDLLAKAVWTGPMDLQRFYGDDAFNFDGSRKRSRSPAFTTLDLRAERRLGLHWRLFAGIDNATNFRQTSVESPLFVDSSGAEDFIYLWGPSRGRTFYFGVRAEI